MLVADTTLNTIAGLAACPAVGADNSGCQQRDAISGDFAGALYQHEQNLRLHLSKLQNNPDKAEAAVAANAVWNQAIQFVKQQSTNVLDGLRNDMPGRFQKHLESVQAACSAVDPANCDMLSGLTAGASPSVPAYTKAVPSFDGMLAAPETSAPPADLLAVSSTEKEEMYPDLCPHVEKKTRVVTRSAATFRLSLFADV